MAWRLLVLLLVTAAPAVSARAADPGVAALIERARAQKAALAYDEALVTLDRTLALGRAGPAELAEMHRLRGELCAGLGDTDAAVASFRRLLAVDPAALLPAGASPKIRAPFEAARASLAGRAPLMVRVDGPAGGTLTVVVVSDPVGLVAGARARAGGVATEGRGGPRITLAAPPAAGPLTVAALDDRGNELVVLERVPPASRRRRPWARWSVWAAAAAATGAAGTLFALELRADQRQLDDMRAHSAEHAYSDVLPVIDRGRRDAALANVGFGVAAACAVTAGVLLYRDRAAGARRARWLVVPAGAGVEARVEF